MYVCGYVRIYSASQNFIEQFFLIFHFKMEVTISKPVYNFKYIQDENNITQSQTFLEKLKLIIYRSKYL